MTNEEPKLYHERQRLQLCGLHALNNLFQEQTFTKKNLDDIVSEYDKSIFFNEYATVFTGNYDLAILLEALKRKGYSLRAIDPSEPFEKFNFVEYLGLLLNVVVERPCIDRIPLLRSAMKPGRHWFSIGCINSKQFYNMDSKLSRPKLIGDQVDLITYLETLNRTQSYVYIVVQETSTEKP